MNINRSNYEVYFLDYLDGNLPDDQINDFLDFLSNNPDLRDELEAVSSLTIQPGIQEFQNKEALLKNELTGSSPFDYRAVAFMENDLPEEDQMAFLNELTCNPEKQKQFDWFIKTRLHPENAIVFPDKASLRKKPARKIILLWGSRIAAAVILLFAIWAVWDFSSTPEPSQQLVQEQPVVPIQKQLPENSQPANPASEEKNEMQLLAREQQEPVNKPAPTVQPVIPVQSTLQANELAVQREAIPQKLEPLSSQLEHSAGEQLALAGLKKYKANSPTEYLTVDEYLAQKVLNKPKDESLTFGSLLSAGLDAVASVSNDRLEYETNARGKVSEISLNTRILAFSIPLKKDQ